MKHNSILPIQALNYHVYMKHQSRRLTILFTKNKITFYLLNVMCLKSTGQECLSQLVWIILLNTQTCIFTKQFLIEERWSNYYFLNLSLVSHVEYAMIIHGSGESQSWIISPAWVTERQTYGRLCGCVTAGEYIWNNTCQELDYFTP